MIPVGVLAFLAIAAFICVIVVALGKCPAWVPMLLMSVFQLLQVIPK